jgi:hypothetical protein
MQAKPEGLVYYYPWYDEDETTYYKESDLSIFENQSICIGTLDENNEYQEISINDLNIEKWSSSGDGETYQNEGWKNYDKKPITNSTTASLYDCTHNIYAICFTEEGTYRIGLNGSYIRVNVDIPDAAFYTSADGDLDHYILPLGEHYPQTFSYSFSQEKDNELYYIFDTYDSRRSLLTDAASLPAGVSVKEVEGKSTDDKKVYQISLDLDSFNFDSHLVLKLSDGAYNYLNVEQDVADTGLVYTTDINWSGDDIYGIDEDASFKKVLRMFVAEEYPIYLGNFVNDGVTAVSGTPVVVTANGEDAGTAVSFKQNSYTRLFDISFSVSGTYHIGYRGEDGNIDDYITVIVTLPDGGFYSNNSKKDENCIINWYYSKENPSFYLITGKDDTFETDDDGNALFYIWDKEQEKSVMQAVPGIKISNETISGDDKIYTVTVESSFDTFYTTLSLPLQTKAEDGTLQKEYAADINIFPFANGLFLRYNDSETEDTPQYEFSSQVWIEVGYEYTDYFVLYNSSDKNQVALSTTPTIQKKVDGVWDTAPEEDGSIVAETGGDDELTGEYTYRFYKAGTYRLTDIASGTYITVYVSESDQPDFDEILENLAWNKPATNSFTYDGSAKTYNATLDFSDGYSLPEGDSVSFTYVGQTATTPGSYKVTLATISYTRDGVTESYQASDWDLPEEIADGATWTIIRAASNPDTGGVGGVGGGGAAPSAPNDEKTDDDETIKEETTEPVKTGNEVAVGDNTYLVTTTTNGKPTVAFTGGLKNAVKVTIPATVEIDGVTYEVTSVAADAFSGNKKLTTVTIPSTVTTIGKNAFKGCKNLKKIVIPKNVKSIGAKAFANCSKLKSITIKSTVLTKIGSRAFTNIAKKAACKVPSDKKKAYKKLLKKAEYSGTVK